MTKKLTEKQQRFVEAYAETGNATESARRAGYSGNDVTLESMGRENLGKPRIREALANLTKPLHDRAIASAEERQAWLTAVARGEVPEVYIVEGRGTILLGDTLHEIKAGDVIYVEADLEHQFKSQGGELRFLCMVPAHRNCGDPTPGSE